MWDKSNVLFHSNLKKVFLPTAKKKKAKILDPRSPKARHKLKKKWFSRIDAILWKEIPTNLRTLPFRTLKAEAELV